jgi:mRNA deadenylase 3'-5' endonuclease subunit Ccr4
MPQPSSNSNYAYEPVETPLLKIDPDFWWMNEIDRANIQEFLARQLGGQGYRSRSRED